MRGKGYVCPGTVISACSKLVMKFMRRRNVSNIGADLESKQTLAGKEEEGEEIYLPRTITLLNKKNTILMLARSRLPEKQKAIYAGRQHCSYSYINTEKSI